MSWPTIPRIKDGVTTFSEKDVNSIIDALETRTTLLKQSILSEEIINGVGFTDISMDDCIKGQFVAYDTLTCRYVPAEALVTGGSSIDQQLPSDKAYVIGLLISDVYEGQGTVLTSGIIHNTELIDKLLGGAAHVPGSYYLTSNGAITADRTSVVYPIYCGTLTASDCFVIDIAKPDFRTHNHTQYNLNPELWEKISDSADFNNASYRYDGTKDPNILSLFNTVKSGLCLIVNNKVMMEDDFEIADNKVYLKHDIGDVSAINAMFYVSHPFGGVQPWITSMNVNNSNHLIKIDQIGTTAVLDIEFPVDRESRGKGTAISDISRAGIVTSPVVNSIKAGPGITVIQESANAGDYTVATTESLSNLVHLNVLNANGVIFGGDDVVVMKFPANRSSSLIGQLLVPMHVTGTTKARICIYAEGTGSVSPMGTINIKNMLLQSTGVDGLDKPTTPISLTLASESTPNTSKLYKIQSPEFSVDPGALLNVTVSFSAASTALNACFIGLQLSNN